jgi:hypothetical protein
MPARILLIASYRRSERVIHSLLITAETRVRDHRMNFIRRPRSSRNHLADWREAMSSKIADIL